MEQYLTETPLATAVPQLRIAVRGRVFMPDEPGYDEARLAWNRRVVQYPAAIVVAKSAEDVQTAVAFTRQRLEEEVKIEIAN